MRQAAVRDIILKRLKKNGEVTVGEIVAETGFSRAYVHRYFAALRREGTIALLGRANRARYVAAGPGSRRHRDGILQAHKILKNTELSEDRVLEEIRSSSGILRGVSRNVARIIEYAFTEMLNNAIEHSRSESIDVKMDRSDEGVYFRVRDWGIGIFRNIVESHKLASESEAIQELLKGKQTSAPGEHSGEGIFFTSKVVDRLVLKGSGKRMTFDNVLSDIFVQDSAPFEGTAVECWIAKVNKRNLAEVFQEYTGDDFEFDRTKVTVNLFRTQGTPVSRSQARRLLASLERFKIIRLDFKGVDTVGQGFADEIFRIWARSHPAIKIEVINAGENVLLMINRARAAASIGG